MKGKLDGLRATGATVEFEVDATDLSRFHASKFQRIVFNFPHLGGATQEDIAKNVGLCEIFLVQAQALLSRKGQAHVTLRDSSFYLSWGVADLSIPNMRFTRTEPFKADLFQEYGYQETRTNPSAFRTGKECVVVGGVGRCYGLQRVDRVIEKVIVDM